MRLPSLLPLALAGALAAAGCPRRGGGADGAGTDPIPEERFGNSRALVQRFVELASCGYREGRVDRSCGKLKALEQELETARREPATHTKAVATLLNLLDSQRELTRLVAAESLLREAREPRVRPALERALTREPAIAVKVTLLRQLCFIGGGELERLALAQLAHPAPEALRAEAATCLGRGSTFSAAALAALRGALRSDPAALVRGNACGALGAHRAAAAVPEMATALTDPAVAWRCSAALAAVGDQPAYLALVAAVTTSLEGGRMPTPHVTALASFAGRPFFEPRRAHALLGRILGDRRLSWIARQRAAAELGRLGGEAPLRAARADYKDATAEGDVQVREAIERQLAGR